MYAWEVARGLERKAGVLSGSGVGYTGVCMQWGTMILCAKRGPRGSGRIDTSFLLVAREHRWHSGDERVEGEGKIPIGIQRERLDYK